MGAHFSRPLREVGLLLATKVPALYIDKHRYTYIDVHRSITRSYPSPPPPVASPPLLTAGSPKPEAQSPQPAPGFPSPAGYNSPPPSTADRTPAPPSHGSAPLPAVCS